MTGRESALKKRIEKLEERIAKRDRLLDFYARQWQKADRAAHEAREGSRELADLTNAVLIATAIRYGAKSPTGARALALEEVKVPELLDAWTIQAERMKDSYIIRVMKKKG